MNGFAAISGKAWILAAMTAAALALGGCVAAPPPRDRGYAPPPYAPAPGYHQIYRGHDIRYDANLGVYLIVDMPNHYFFNDNYYRYHEGRWYYSRDLEKHWRHYDERKLPPGLAKKYRHDDRDKHGRRDDH